MMSEIETQKENIMEVKKDASYNESKDSNNKQSINATPDNLEEEMLNYVASSTAIFKSQQKEEAELTFEEKCVIAKKLLEKNHCLFLSKFGHYLKEEHLEYFSKNKDYEITFHINRLRRYFNNLTRHVDVRNRRYEAMKILIEKGEYFSECEMMKRNPLLYEHLVGQYLTEAEKKARDSIDTHNINYVDILMETIERDKLQKYLKCQQKEEDSVREENDSDDDNDDNDNDGSVTSKTSSFNEQTRFHWGACLNETIDDDDKNKDKILQNSKIQHKISNEEIQLFRQEFLTNMYQSFLDGNDRNFDYSTVDDNEVYDNIKLRNQDEEEKYFDSESPKTVLSHNESSDRSESEDELDAYMKTLKEQTPTNPHSLDNLT
ncbi:coiled-coil domain-containing protein 97 [Harpegnathos saltator]|uniref:coiled-coil domain-containing protein 97 n=1 Tax=Harpegnathos saltator TaxID=610380 RepID=UPI00058E3B89|nr:coiled-coil domain-containing protein 97 [Harpegnathos saltator]